MKIVVMGAGALGSVYGGYLARAGFDVTLIGRSAHMQAIQMDGLRVTGLDDFVARPAAVTDARQVGEADLLLMCVRTTDREQALADVAHLRPEMVVSFENGLRKDEALIRQFGPGPVLGATSIVGARVVEPGHARCTLFAHTWFGELDNCDTPRLQALVGAWRKAGMLAETPDSIQAAEWTKLAYLLPVSTLSGLTRLPYHQVLQTPDIAYLFVQLTREVNKVAQAYSIQLGDYSGIGVRALLHSPFEQSVQVLIARGDALAAGGQTDISANMLYDLMVGRQTEIEAIAGDLVRLASDAGISVPGINFVYRAIRGIDHWARG